MRRFLAGVSRRFSVVSVWLRRDCDALPHLVSRMAPSHWSKDRNEHAEHETLHWISFYNGDRLRRTRCLAARRVRSN